MQFNPRQSAAGSRVLPAGLKRICVDACSRGNGPVAVGHDGHRVVCAGAGRSAETLEAFFAPPRPVGCERIELVTANPAARRPAAAASCSRRFSK